MFKQNTSDMTVNRTWKFNGYLGEFNIKITNDQESCSG